MSKVAIEREAREVPRPANVNMLTSKTKRQNRYSECH